METEIKKTPVYKKLEFLLASELKKDFSGKMASGENYFEYWNNQGNPINEISLASEEKKLFLKLANTNLENPKMINEICNLLEPKNLTHFTYYAAHGIGSFRLFMDYEHFNKFTKQFNLEIEEF